MNLGWIIEMRIKKHYQKVEKIHLHPPLKDGNCMICERRVKKLYYTGKKKVRTTQGVWVLYYWIYCCMNSKCEAFRKPLRHPPINLKHKEFGNDVIALVGFLRYTKKMTYAEIRDKLMKRGIEIGQYDSSIKNITETYLQLINATPLATVPKNTRQQLQTEGIILAVDGIQPEKGNAVLYLISDVQSGELLYARELAESNTDELITFLQVIQDLNLPVRGIISDKQHALVKALQTLWPGVPHQFCQLHFLMNLAKPVTEADRALKKELKKEIKGIKEIQDKFRSKKKNMTLGNFIRI